MKHSLHLVSLLHQYDTSERRHMQPRVKGLILIARVEYSV